MSDARLPTLTGEELEPFFAARAGGSDYRQALERVLLDLPLERAELLMQRLREGRAAFVTLAGTARGRALLIGDALSGSALALARSALALTVVDDDERRLRFASERDVALARGCTAFVRCSATAALPFDDAAFDLVVDERGAPSPSELAEAARVSRGEVLSVCDNRFAYKLSSGLRADFRVVGPLGLARRALRPPLGERSLLGWRRLHDRAGLRETEAQALYPHRFDFSHVVALDTPLPKLTVGPKERANRLKVAARSAGLFPLLTPSFVLRASRTRLGPAWIDGALEHVAHEVGDPRPTVEHLIATRGNTCVFLTRGPDWCVHLPLSPAQERQSRRHFEALGRLRRDHPTCPAARPIWEGERDGRYLCVEERLDGLSAPQLTGDLSAAANTYRGVARALGALVTRPAGPLSAETIEQLVDRRLAATAPRAAHSETAATLERIAATLRERLASWRLPLVLHHSDLRAKHVQVREDGALLGLMDFGSYERADLPLFDLINLVVHDAKQRRAGWTIGDAWRTALEGGWTDFERAAIDDYAARLELPEDYPRAVLEALPLLVGAMAESNWDYSRPRWIRRSFGL